MLLLEESNPDEPIATSSQTLPEPIEPIPVPSITVSSPIPMRGAKQEDVYAWTKVKKAFADYFLPRSQVSSAIAAMNVLKQTGTVKEYVAKFRSLASQLGQPVAANETYFIKGLNKGLQYKIVAQDPNGRDTYEKLYALTERLDEAYQMLPKEERHESASRKSYQRSPARYQNRGKKNYGTSIGRLNPEQRRQYLGEGRCFECGEHGHIAAECSKNEQKPTSRVGQIRAIMQGLEGEDRAEAKRVIEDF